MLLVLDNCEHVLDDAAAVVRAILSRTTAVSILATSREALDVPGEQAWPVPALAHHGADAPAVELFVERARSVAPDFDPAAELDVILEICSRLDGIPLAIELAAARVRSLSARQVHERLNERFQLLRTTDRAAVRRHRALDEAVRWSFDLLTAAEREVLCRLSVFSGGFTLDAAEMLSSASDGSQVSRSPGAAADTIDVIDSLVRKSLVTVDRRSRELRYGLLETIREFAEHQLEHSGGVGPLRDAHARHFAARADANRTAWASAAQGDAYDWFTAELANLRTA
jgi:predicted ATPase